MDNNIELVCLSKDLALVKKVIPQAVETFKKVVKVECRKDFNIEVTVNEKNFLDESDKNSIGGIVLSSFGGKIKCSNTIEERINLSFQEYLPLIKETCFPSMNH